MSLRLTVFHCPSRRDSSLSRGGANLSWRSDVRGNEKLVEPEALDQTGSQRGTSASVLLPNGQSNHGDGANARLAPEGRLPGIAPRFHCTGPIVFTTAANGSAACFATIAASASPLTS